MAANYGTIKEFQVLLVADTSNTLTITGFYGSQSKLVITAPASRTKPVSFIFRSSGSTEPVTVDASAALEDGTLSPRMKPGYPIEVDIPSGSTTLVLKSFEAGDVYVTIYEVVG